MLIHENSPALNRIPSETTWPRVVAIVQARTGSTRLPGKVLMPILGRPMIEHQLARVKLASSLDEVVVATTTDPQDGTLLELASRVGVKAFAGSVEDVLDRFYQAASREKADVVVRLTADCPLLDPGTIDQVVNRFLTRGDEIDYLGVGPTFPDGIDVEALSYAALARAWREADKAYEREHVTVYVWQSGRFRAERLEYATDLSAMRWTVDEPADFAFVTAVYETLFPRCGYRFDIADILALLAERPELTAINAGIRRNEGFLKSLRVERSTMINMRQRPLTCSAEYWNRAQSLIPAGTQTLSKGPTQYVDPVAPKYLARGRGCHVWDVDGNEYIDYPMGLGAVILGHHYPATDEAIRKQLDDGIAFSLMHPLEVEVAELIRDLVPCAEMVRFGKNGSDATTGAVRVARAYTGREKIAHCGYHGWHDWYIASTTRNRGVPQSAVEQQFGFVYNDLESLRAIFERHPGEIAVVIMEPYGATMPEPGFLEGVKQVTHANGAVLVFDEVATGFRFQVGGVHQYFGVDPDLACFGKAMANGMPLSALVGRAEIMRAMDEVFYSFTFGGECLSLAAARATLDEMRTQPVIDHIWEIGTRLREGFNRLIADFGMQRYIDCVGLAPRTFVMFRDIDDTPALIVKSLFQQEVLKRGVLSLTGAHCVTFSHTVEDVEYTLAVYQEALEIVKRAAQQRAVRDRLEGRPIEPVFRPIR